MASGTVFTTITAGDYHSLALTEAGELYAWGNNGAGQLGDGTRIHRAIPTRITALPPTTTVTEIAAGNYASLGLTSDGMLYGWGSSQRGRLGLGSSRRRPPGPPSCSPAAPRPAR